MIPHILSSNNCKTSIFDLHRSCTHCSYDLCVICCRELRNGCLRDHDEMILRLRDPGVAYLHGEKCCHTFSKCNETLDNKFRTKDEGHVRSEFEWKSCKDGSILCPPENFGGCGKGKLILKQVLPANWVSNMLVKAEEFIEINRLKDMPETSACRCSCFTSVFECDPAKEMLRESVSLENSDDTVVDIQHGDLKHFQSHWVKGEPVIVSNVLETTSGLSWEPMVMSRALGERRPQFLDFFATNCLNWCEVCFFQSL